MNPTPDEKPETPDAKQERQHRQNVVRLDLNTVLTSIFGLAIMAGIGALYNKAEAITVIQTQIPYIQGQIASLYVQQTQNSEAISKIPEMMEHNRVLIEADVLRNAKKYGNQPELP